MVRNYKRKTQKANWSEDDLKNALKSIEKKEMSIRAAAVSFQIPFSTLQERVKSGNINAPNIGRKTELPPELEIKLAERVKLLGKIFYGVTSVQLRRAAFDLAESKNINHRFNKNTRMAGKDWLNSFLERHRISVRKPENISVNRVTAFNKEEISIFFDNLEELYSKYSISGLNIWNVDETGVSTVLEAPKILTETGQKRAGSISSWERGKNTTVVCAMSAVGQLSESEISYASTSFSEENLWVDEIYCICEEFGKDEELWFRCTQYKCGHWTHQACSGYDTAEKYVCDHHE